MILFPKHLYLLYPFTYLLPHVRRGSARAPIRKSGLVHDVIEVFDHFDDARVVGGHKVEREVDPEGDVGRHLPELGVERLDPIQRVAVGFGSG